MQETWVQCLVWEDPTCSREAKPMYGNYWACSLELGAETSEPMCHSSWTSTPTAHGLQQERLLQWEVCAPQLEGSPCLLQPEKSPCSSKDPGQQKSKWMKMKKKKRCGLYTMVGVCVWVMWRCSAQNHFPRIDAGSIRCYSISPKCYIFIPNTGAGKDAKVLISPGFLWPMIE